ncbi:MAG: BON domain-containing protein [Rhizobacter sp.]|nr:BON domain-containing protein [Rhizobacter sp.]
MRLATRFASAVLTAALAATTVGCATHDTSVGTKVDDTVITTKVKTALLGDPDVKGTSISVETVNGTVQLTGFVDSQAQRSRAQDLASRVDGVHNVDNRITVNTK